MFASLVLAAAFAGGEPAYADEAFCTDLRAFAAAASEAPDPFASLIDPTVRWFGTGSGTRSIQGFGACSRYRFENGWTVTCHGLPGAPLERAQARLAARVAECLKLPPVALPSRGFGLPVTEFRGPTFTVVVDTKSCDRCRGMPEVVLRIVAPKRS